MDLVKLSLTTETSRLEACNAKFCLAKTFLVDDVVISFFSYFLSFFGFSNNEKTYPAVLDRSDHFAIGSSAVQQHSFVGCNHHMLAIGPVNAVNAAIDSLVKGG